MKTYKLLLTSLFTVVALSVSAQGTAFTYQGRLNDTGSPANGLYDLRFTVCDVLNNGNIVAGPVTNTATGVTNGLFRVSLNFGNGVFTGPARWLQLDVRTNGNGAFNTLVPRQQILPTPYAIMANTASNLLGALPVGQLGAGTANISISGNAATATTATTATSATSATTATTANNFSGSLSGDVTGTQSATSISAGAVNHIKLASDAASLAKVSGGVMTSLSNYVGIATATPGSALDVNGDLSASRLKIGVSPTLTGGNASIAGGTYNYALGAVSVVCGGSWNSAAGRGSFVGGGGDDGTAMDAGNTATGPASAIVGGYGNYATNTYAFTGGGKGNVAGGIASTIAGGYGNTASGIYATVGGGWNNQASQSSGTISGGFNNYAPGIVAAIGGGFYNTASGIAAFVGGGGTIDGSSVAGNFATGAASVVGGGANNEATASCATVPGGNNNRADGQWSFAAGNDARAEHQGAFVWADSQSSLFSSTANDQVSFRCQGGVRFTSGGSGSYNTVSWAPGSGSWSFTSDRHLKESFTQVDTRSLLEKISRLPITEWNYIGYAQRHIGPMAQDWHALFPLNDSDTMLNSADEAGVSLAAIQGLNQKLDETRAENAELKHEVAELKAIVEKLAGK